MKCSHLCQCVATSSFLWMIFFALQIQQQMIQQWETNLPALATPHHCSPTFSIFHRILSVAVSWTFGVLISVQKCGFVLITISNSKIPNCFKLQSGVLIWHKFTSNHFQKNVAFTSYNTIRFITTSFLKDKQKTQP